jgi:hypothetical protein
LKDINQYQRIVEKLIYLTITTLDLTFVVGKISQSIHDPRIFHMEAIDRIMRYLKGTSGQKIFTKK